MTKIDVGRVEQMVRPLRGTPQDGARYCDHHVEARLSFRQALEGGKAVMMVVA